MAHIPGWNTSTGKSDDVGYSFELYYDYPVNDGMSIKPMVYTTNHNTSGSTTWVDMTAFAVETTFKF